MRGLVHDRAAGGGLVTAAVKVALVTGAASGMGRRWAERMAKAGVRVAAVDRDGAQLAAAWQGVPGVSTHVCDVTP